VAQIYSQNRRLRINAAGRYGERLQEFKERIAKASSGIAGRTRQNERCDPLSALLLGGWRRDDRSKFLQVEYLQTALETAAARRLDKRFTSRQLFDDPVPSLGGRTRLVTLCELCAELTLEDVYTIAVDTTQNVMEFVQHLSWHKLKVRLTRPGKKKRKRKPYKGRNDPVRDARLLARAMKEACDAHLARDPEFAGKARYGDKFELAVRPPRGTGDPQRITARVASMNWDDATIDLAEMAPVSAGAALPKHITHVYTGVVRTLGFHDFAVALALAADGVCGGAGGRAGGTGAAAATGAARASREPIVLQVPADQVIGRGYFSGTRRGFLVCDKLCAGVKLRIKKICGMIDTFEWYGSKFGKGARHSFRFDQQCAKWAGGAAPEPCRTNREARANGAILGFTGASCGVNLIRKPAYLWSKKGRSEYTNYPIPYAHAVPSSGGADPAEKLGALLIDPQYLELLENLQDKVAELYGQEVVDFILSTVPAEFRLAEHLIWNQAAMTGGSHTGHCAKHVDRFNLLNGLYHFSGADDNVKGGETVFFNRDTPEEQDFAAAFKCGRCIVGPFSKVYHGSTWSTGGRAILGANVDRRIVKFCLAFKRTNGNWEPRAFTEFEPLEKRFNSLVSDLGL
jgi:hypothetical protein